MYEISRAMKHGVALTSKQRSSSMFAEEPRIAGKVLRRGSPPLKLTDAQYEACAHQISLLVAAGSIVVRKIGGVSEARVLEAPETLIEKPEPKAEEVVEVAPEAPTVEVTTPPQPVDWDPTPDPTAETVETSAEPAPVVEEPAPVVAEEPVVVESSSKKGRRSKKGE